MLFVCLALGALPSFGGSEEAATPIVLYTQFQQEAPAALMTAIRNELATIMSPTGVRFAWHSLDEAGNQVYSQLAVVKFKGKCDAEGLRPETAFPGPLGWTHVSDGEILPFIDVNCDGIRLFLQRGLLLVHGEDRETILGRAMGRVLAHELYHLLANTQEHTRRGIAKAAYNVGELLSQTLEFSKKECDTLRQHTAYLGGSPSAQGQ
jgi:hypothetical protein